MDHNIEKKEGKEKETCEMRRQGRLNKIVKSTQVPMWARFWSKVFQFSFVMYCRKENMFAREQ